MDWKAIAGLIAPFAPTAGRFLGGLVPFPGASIVGGLLGDAIAAALGVEATPEAVGKAIETMPPDQLQARLDAVEGEAKAKYDAMARIAEAEAQERTAQSQAINETIRAEAAQGVSWWHWRHLLGYVPVLIGVEVASLLPLFLAGKITPTDMVAVIGAITPFLTIVSALLGYVAQDTTKLKATAITGEHAPSMTDNLVKVVKSAVGKPPVVTVAVPKPSPLRRQD